MRQSAAFPPKAIPKFASRICDLKSGSINTGARRLCCWNNLWLTAWTLQKSTIVQQLLLNICVGIFPEVSNIASSKHISEIQTKEYPPKNPAPFLKASKQNSIWGCGILSKQQPIQESGLFKNNYLIQHQTFVCYELFIWVGWNRPKVHSQVIIKNITSEGNVYNAISAKIRQTKK